MPMLHLPVPLASQYDAYGDYEDSEDFGEDFQNNDMYLKAFQSRHFLFSTKATP